MIPQFQGILILREFGKIGNLDQFEFSKNSNIGLQFLASGLSISHEIRQISGEIHPKPYKIRCFNKNYSVWWMQERGYDLGSHEIWGHSPPPCTPPNWRVFVETSDLIRFGVDFTWNLPDFTWNPPDFMKSTRFHRFHGEIHPISWNPPDFNGEIHLISWNPLDFTDFKIMSFCVIIKYRSFVFRKTN